MNVIAPDDFDIHGHLSDKFIILKAKIDALAPGFFETANILNRIAQDALSASSIKRNNESQYVRYLLFLHILRTYQGLIRLIYCGLQEQSIMLLRVEMEALFKLKAIRDKPDLVEIFQKDFSIQRKAYGKNLKKLIEIGTLKLSTSEIKSLEHDLHEIEKIKKDGYKVNEWAEAAGLQSMYMMLYPLFSQPIHSNPHQLDKYLSIDNHENDINLNPFPKYDQLQKSLHLGMTLLLIATDCIDDVIKTPRGKAKFTERLRLVKSKLKRLADETV